MKFTKNTQKYEEYKAKFGSVLDTIKKCAPEEDVKLVEKLIKGFQRQVEDFYRDGRKLNIGVIGQVKAGKSSFLNTLLFEGKDVLPKAATPKTATLTKIEYATDNRIEIEYYSEEDWENVENAAKLDLDDENTVSSKELVDMVKNNGINVRECLKKQKEIITFATYDDLVSHLNDYVGGDGMYTPVVKNVILYVNDERFEGISIVDTPGLNDPIVSRTIKTRDFIEVCDVVFFLSPVTSFMDKTDCDLLLGQLPGEGVKRMVVVGSKLDSGLRDTLRKKDEDDIFGEDENHTDNVADAFTMVTSKLKKRVGNIIKAEKERQNERLLDALNLCKEPILICSMADNMVGKAVSDYSDEEKNLYNALLPYSKNYQEDLGLLTNGIENIRGITDKIVKEKEKILKEKEGTIYSDKVGELKEQLQKFRKMAEERRNVLTGNDKAQLEEKRQSVNEQINSIKSSLDSVISDLMTKLEVGKSEASSELHKISADYVGLRERTGTITHFKSYRVSDSHWYNPFSWGKSHRESYSYDETYTYWLAADAVENITKYAHASCAHVEGEFVKIVGLRELKRKLLNVVSENFKMDENFDTGLFISVVDKTVSSIELPVFSLNIDDKIKALTNAFPNEIKSSTEKNKLAALLTDSVAKVYEDISKKLVEVVKQYKVDLDTMGGNFQKVLLKNIQDELQLLISQCENKEREIKHYGEYIDCLKKEIEKLG